MPLAAQHLNANLTSVYGVSMPRIIYGTAWKKAATAGLVEQALNFGFRGIDTACQPKHYHEAGVGDGLMRFLQQGGQREAIYLQTKFTPLSGQDPANVPYAINASLTEQVQQSFAVSLQNLHTSYLDCLILHSPLAEPKQLLEVWRAMEQLFQSGGVKQLGMSNCYDLALLQYLYTEATVKPAVLQNRFYQNTHYDQAIRAFCQAQQLIYQSFWTLSANPHILKHALVQQLAHSYQRSAAQILFRCLQQIGILPLTGTTSAQHMQESLAIAQFELTAEECQQVAILFV